MQKFPLKLHVPFDWGAEPSAFKVRTWTDSDESVNFTLRFPPEQSGLNVLKSLVSSTGRRNTLAEPFSRCFIIEGLSGTLVKLSCYRI